MTGTPPITLLLVCRANQCRSPMAEVACRQRAEARDAALKVESAGLLDGGQPATAHACTVVSERGLDLSSHRSRRVSAALVQDADLVLTMTRRQLREVAVLEPRAFARTFTLKELARRAAGLPRNDGEPVDAWLQRVGAGRRSDALLGDAASDDVADPVGGPLEAYRRTLDEIETALDVVLSALRPERPRR